MVEPIRPQDAAGVYQRQIGDVGAVPAGTRRGAGEATNAPRVDSVSVSDRARLVHGVLEHIGASDAERAELVERLRGEVDAGTYTIDAQEIARRMTTEQTR